MRTPREGALRQVFTVTFPMQGPVGAAKKEIEMMQDEVGEYLYGGGGNGEVTLHLEQFRKGKWVRI